MRRAVWYPNPIYSAPGTRTAHDLEPDSERNPVISYKPWVAKSSAKFEEGSRKFGKKFAQKFAELEGKTSEG